MSWLLHAGLSNAAIATLMAIPAWFITRRLRRPALAHALWLIVLLKLVTPPLVPVRVLPMLSEPEPPPVPVAILEPETEPRLKPVSVVSRSVPMPKPDAEEKKMAAQMAAFMDMLLPPELRMIKPPPIPDPLAETTSLVEDTVEEPEAIEVPVSLPLPAPIPTKSSPPVNAAFNQTKILAGVWLVGTVGWLALALRRGLKFRRWLRYAEPAPASLVTEVVRLSRRMGLARCPAVRLVPGPLPPMIWAAGSRATLYFPTDLLRRLDAAKRDTLFVHELAHLCRRDHWVRWLEIVTLAVYWWLPLAWLARRGLQRAEEECCDARVLESLPGSGRIYAEALLDAVDFLAGAPCLPPVASGITPANSIKRRLLMILQGPPHPRLPMSGRLAVALCALGLLPLLAAPQEKNSAPTVTPVAAAGTSTSSLKTADEPYLFDQRPTLLQSSAPRWWFFAISPDGKTMAVAEGDADQLGEITIFDLPAGTVKKTIKHSNGIRCCNFSPDGKTLAAGYFDGSIHLFDVATWKAKAIGSGHTGAVNSLAFTSDGKRLVSAALDHHVKVWTVPNAPVPADDKAKLPEFTPFATLNEHTNWALSVAVSKDGKTIVSGGRDDVARIWDMPEPAADGKLLRVTKCKMVLAGHTSAIEVVAISPDGATIATGSWDNSARLWDAKDGKSKREFPTQGGGINALAISRDGKEFAIGIDIPQRSLVRRFNLEDGKQLGQHDHAQTVRCLAYHPTAAELFSLGEERVVKRSNLTGSGTLGVINGPAKAAAPQIVLALAYSPDGKSLAVAGDNKKISITTLADKQTRTWDAHDDVIWTVLFSKDGKTLFTGSSDKTVKVWDLAEWKAGDPAPPVKVLKGHTNWIFCLAISPDGKKLASGSYDKSIRLWDLAAWKAADAQPPVKVLKTHSASVHSVAFSPDGILLISGSADRTIRIWTTNKGEQLGIIRGHKGAIRAVAFSPDGKTIASGSEDKTVKLWDLVPEKDGAVTGKMRAELNDHPDMIGAIAFSPKGRSLLAGAWNGQVYLWDPDLAKRRLIMNGHSDAVTAVAFSPDGQQFASGSYDKTVRLWPPTAPPTPGLLSYGNHLDAVWSIALSKDGKWAATGSRDGAIRIFDRGNTTPKHVISNAHSGGVTQVAFSPDSQTIASVGKDKIVRTWTAAGAPLRQFAGHTDEILKVAFHPNGKLLATAGADSDIRIWDTGRANGAGPLKTLSGHTEPIHGLAFSPNGKLLASAGMDRTWRLWDTEKWETKLTSGTSPNNGHFLALDFSPDGKTLALGHSQDQEIDSDGQLLRQQYRNVMFIDTETGKPKSGLGANAFLHPDWITGLAYTADGQTVITASRDFIIRFWSLKTNQITRQFRAHNAGISQVVIAPEDGLIATAGEDRVATIWSAILRMQSTRAMLTGHSGQIWFTALTQDGELMATGGTDKRVLLREGFRGTQPFTFDGSFKTVYSIAASPNGKMIASGHEDGTIHLWDADSGKPIKTLTGHTMRVWSLAFTADSKHLFSSSGDWENKDKPGEVKQWNLDDGKVVREFPGHTGLVYNVALSPDGKTLVTASHDKTIRVWDLTGRAGGGNPLLKTLTGHKASVRSVQFSPDGQTLVSCGNGDIVLADNAKPDGTVIFWDVKDWKEKSRFNLPTGMQVNRAKYSPDGKTVAIAGNLPKTAGEQAMVTKSTEDGTVTQTVQSLPAGSGGRLLFWDVETGKVRKEAFPVQSEKILDLAFAPGGHTVAAVGGEYNAIGNVRFYDVAFGNRVGELHGHKLWCEAVAFTNDGRIITGGGIAGQPGELKIWNAKGMRALKGLEGHEDTISAAAFSPDKKQLATGDGKGNVYLWDLSVWPPKGDVAKRLLKGPTRMIRTLIFTADGKTVISCADGGWVWMWDTATGEKKRVIQAAQRPVYAMALSPNGKLLVTAHGNWQQNLPGEVKIWDMDTGSLVKELPSFPRHVWNVAFTPDGRKLVIVGGQMTAKIWDTATWTEKLSLAVPLGVRAMAISPNGKIIATASETANDPVVHLWDAETGQEQAALQGAAGLIFCLRFTPDGKTLFGSGDGAAVHVWDVPAPKARPAAVVSK